MTYKLNVGDKMPYFRCKDEEGIEVTKDDVIGSPVVIYFYPKNDTPTCTLEACNFRDNIARLEETDTLVIGVSPDTMESHQQFIDKHELNFTLLADANKEMCNAFDVFRDGKIERTTFVINPDGVISWIERPVNVDGHIDRVLAAVNACA